uniref:Uncharacterized protein n=2 Tax=Cacopsylla melanoneura TaxID=428564 RepID=A0A8D8YE58_9HEMI
MVSPLPGLHRLKYPKTLPYYQETHFFLFDNDATVYCVYFYILRNHRVCNILKYADRTNKCSKAFFYLQIFYDLVVREPKIHHNFGLNVHPFYNRYINLVLPWTWKLHAKPTLFFPEELILALLCTDGLQRWLIRHCYY